MTQLCRKCEKRRPRRVRGARYCSACVGKYPKQYCDICEGMFFRDMMATRTQCRKCHRAAIHEKRMVDRYGLAPGQYQELLLYQGGKSAIAGQRPGTKRLAVDHDHKTGRVRGLLTKHENLYVIGWAERFEDPIAVLQAAIEYLASPPAQRLWGNDAPRVPEVDDDSA